MLRLAVVIPVVLAFAATPALLEEATPPSVTAEPNSEGGLDITIHTHDSSDVKDLHVLPPETPKGAKVDADIDVNSLPSGWTGRPSGKGLSFGAGSSGSALPANSTHTFKLTPGSGSKPHPGCSWSLTRDGAAKPPKDPYPGDPGPTDPVINWGKGDPSKPFRIPVKGVTLTIPPETSPAFDVSLDSDAPVNLDAFCDGEPSATFRVFVLETTPRAQKLRHVQTGGNEDRTLGFDGEVCTNPPFFIMPDHGALDATAHASIAVRRYEPIGDRTYDLIFVVDDNGDRRFTVDDVAGVIEIHN